MFGRVLETPGEIYPHQGLVNIKYTISDQQLLMVRLPISNLQIDVSVLHMLIRLSLHFISDGMPLHDPVSYESRYFKVFHPPAHHTVHLQKD